VQKTPKSALKGDSTNGQAKTQTRFASDSQTVASQVTTISQLTDMVFMVQQDHKTLMSRFEHLTEQITLLLSAQQPSTMQCPARGQDSESGQQT